MQEKKTRNPRSKDQNYCGEAACQQARKATWEHDKCKTDPQYNTKRQKRNERWRKKRPAHKYQADYRVINPDYTEDNRIKQQVRNQKRTENVSPKQSEQKIVKTDALSRQSPVYEMKSFTLDASGQKIVKTDTLFVQFTATEGVAPIKLHRYT